MSERGEKKLEGCLLATPVNWPQKKVLLCGLCPNKSTDVGNLADQCKQSK